MNRTSAENHYEVLGVRRTATPDEIKAAYRQRSRREHPDRGGSHVAQQRLNLAYAVLSDPEKRRQYDEQLDLEPVRQAGQRVAARGLEEAEALAVDAVRAGAAYLRRRILGIK